MFRPSSSYLFSCFLLLVSSPSLCKNNIFEQIIVCKLIWKKKNSPCNENVTWKVGPSPYLISICVKQVRSTWIDFPIVLIEVYVLERAQLGLKTWLNDPNYPWIWKNWIKSHVRQKSCVRLCRTERMTYLSTFSNNLDWRE